MVSFMQRALVWINAWKFNWCGWCLDGNMSILMMISNNLILIIPMIDYYHHHLIVFIFISCCAWSPCLIPTGVDFSAGSFVMGGGGGGVMNRSTPITKGPWRNWHQCSSHIALHFELHRCVFYSVKMSSKHISICHLVKQCILLLILGVTSRSLLKSKKKSLCTPHRILLFVKGVSFIW